MKWGWKVILAGTGGMEAKLDGDGYKVCGDRWGWE